MKKLSLKSKILLVAFLIGGFGAGAHELAMMSTAQASLYDWESTSIAPEFPNSTLNDATRTQAINHFGCENGADLCVRGEWSGGAPGDPVVELNFN